MTFTGLPLLDHIESEKRRDVALQRVAENSVEWMPLALLELEQLARNPAGWANLEKGFTGEFIRQALTPRIGHPHHSNAWGALVRTAIGREIIVATGEYRAMQRPSTATLVGRPSTSGHDRVVSKRMER